MGPKQKLVKKAATSAARKSTSPKPSSAAASAVGGKDLPPWAGYLVSCDIPTKQFIQHLNDKKGIDKKFIIEDLDAEHMLVRTSAREYIDSEVERWMDENVFSSVERVGENFDMSQYASKYSDVLPLHLCKWQCKKEGSR
jgi:hypothetical protein